VAAAGKAVLYELKRWILSDPPLFFVPIENHTTERKMFLTDPGSGLMMEEIDYR